MIAKKIMANPVFMIGILFMAIFLIDLKRKGKFGENKLHAKSCRSAIVMLEKRAPSFWDISCDKNTLLVKIDHAQNAEIALSLKKSPRNSKKIYYRQVANDLSFIAANTLNEALERSDYVVLKSSFNKVMISTLSKGKAIAQMRSISSREVLLQHLRAHVQIQEVPQTN